MLLARLLAATCLVVAAPVAVLLALLATGVAAKPVALGIAVVLAAGLLLVLLWARDIARVQAALRLAVADPAAGLARRPPRPRLAPLAVVAEEIGRLARTASEQASQVGRLRRADQGIVEHLPDPLLVLGADRGVRRANAAARAAFRGDIASVLRHPGLRAAIDRGLAQGARQTAQVTLPLPVERELAATVLILDPPLADGGQIVVVLADRTRERAVERMRADFVANVSHELRTPLASLIGFIETLRGAAADDPPAQARFLGIMAEQAGRMNRLIDDLLGLSRIELTEHQRPAGQVDLASLIPRIAAGFEPGLDARRMRLELDVTRPLPVVEGDADQLAQVLQNLMDNAMKYGREGGTVRVAAAAAQGERWPARPGIVLAVSDDGPGIAREHLPRLTERFYRVDKGRSRAVGGTGLGLAIVKHIVNRHRGQFQIDSVEGQGSTFRVWLPVAEPQPGALPPGGFAARERGGHPTAGA
ncbi:MAG TPA: ATP-binding protein [Acetobacteraceae bacterium]|nr:ATP-binding protein [Acetobacteraceae bacterium]